MEVRAGGGHLPGPSRAGEGHLSGHLPGPSRAGGGQGRWRSGPVEVICRAGGGHLPGRWRSSAGPVEIICRAGAKRYRLRTMNFYNAW